MRVLLTAHRLPPDGVAGVERYTMTLARELAGHGDEVSLLARRQGDSSELRLIRERTPEGLMIQRVVGGRVGPTRFLAEDGRQTGLTAAAFVEAAPDVVHVNHLWGLDPQFMEIALRYCSAIVVSLHDFFFACPLVHLKKVSGDICHGARGGVECAQTCFRGEGSGGLLRWGMRASYFGRLLSSAHRVICYSDYVGSYFEKLGVERTRLRMITQGVTASLVTGEGLDQGLRRERETPLRIAFVGTLVHHKGAHVLMDAIRFAGLGSVELRLIGDSPDRQYFSHLMEIAGSIPGLAVQHRGAYEPQDLRDLLRGTDCVVVPSIVLEAGPIVPREALALGLPVIVSDAGALPEVVEDGVNGMVFPSGRPRVLGGILQRLARAERLLTRLQEGARRTPVFTSAQHSEQVREVYLEAQAQERTDRYSVGGKVEELAFLRAALRRAGFGGESPPRGGYGGLPDRGLQGGVPR
jgi:glycosyltransferase involved in cell wall biosynthesis